MPPPPISFPTVRLGLKLYQIINFFVFLLLHVSLLIFNYKKWKKTECTKIIFVEWAIFAVRWLFGLFIKFNLKWIYLNLSSDTLYLTHFSCFLEIISEL